MKKILALILTIVCILSAVPCFADGEPAPDVAAEAALLMNMETGEVLFEKNAKERMYPASMTKMLTAILVLENLDMNKRITVQRDEIQGVGGTTIKLTPGEQIDIGILLSATMVASANDGAAVLAHEVAGSQSAFAEMMNNKAKEIGCTDSNFVNPHGLHDADHYSTCYDIAAIARYAMKNETFRRIVAKAEFTVPVINTSSERHLKNTNLLLNDELSENKVTVNGVERYCKYEGCIGIKTGYTSQAGACLCSAVEKDGTTLLCVVMKSDDLGRFADSIALFDWGFAQTNSLKVLEAGYNTGTVKLKKAKPSKIETVLAEDAFVSAPKNTPLDQFTTDIVFDKNLKAPINEGDIVGILRVYQEEKLLGEYDIVASTTAEAKTSLGFFAKLFIIIGAIIIFLIVYVILFLIADKKRNDARKARIAERRAASLEQEARLHDEFGDHSSDE
ncbi:MAG: D-alanyl-D-alanine carboxypeptidase family protein [Bacillota bacterium]|nr:D-alanyl-D-alanine carboxypeptidase family protein [Bacillota bacterium]